MEEPKSIASVADAGLEKYLADSIVLLVAVRSGLADLLKGILDGDATAVKAAADKQAELEKALKRVFEAEDRFNEWRARGIEHGTDHAIAGDIDFDAVRQEIGCRLGRIRECCQSD